MHAFQLCAIIISVQFALHYLVRILQNEIVALHSDLDLFCFEGK